MIDKLYPISIKNIVLIVDKVHSRYPKLSKDKVAIIIKLFFILIRRLMLAGETISIIGLFTDLKLIRFKRGAYYVIKTKLKTSEYFKSPRD